MDDDRAREFSALYRADFNDLVRFLMRAVGATHHDAADAAQKAYKQAWEQWCTLTSPRAWVRTVAKREFYKSAPDRDMLTDTPPDRPMLHTPEATLVISESTQFALNLLAALPTMQRIVLAWYADGFTTEEIATQLRMSKDAVRQNLHRARVALKARLEQMVEEVNREQPFSVT